MAKNSPFSVAHRKTLFITSDDRRNKNSSFNARIGRKVIVKDTTKSVILSKYINTELGWYLKTLNNLAGSATSIAANESYVYFAVEIPSYIVLSQQGQQLNQVLNNDEVPWNFINCDDGSIIGSWFVWWCGCW